MEENRLNITMTNNDNNRPQIENQIILFTKFFVHFTSEYIGVYSSWTPRSFKGIIFNNENLLLQTKLIIEKNAEQ